MSTSSSFQMLIPKISHSPHPKFIYSKSILPSKPLRFSSISIERMPLKIYSSASSSVDSTSTQSTEELPPKLQEIVNLFQSVEDSKAKYQQLLFYGRKLTPLETKFKTKENKVQGCVSQVWVRAYLDSEKNVHFEADSDSSLTKGLAALLVQGLSGEPISEIVSVSPNFITLLGLQQSLTPSRNNGFLNMLKLMQIKAVQLYKEAEEGVGLVNNGISEVDDNANLDEESEIPDEQKIEEKKPDLGSRGERIKEILTSELSPVDLKVEDISHQHAGHAGVGRNAVETHFNVKIVSKVFEGKSLVKRHRLVYDVLQNELQTGLHALSIVAKTPSDVGR
ncbi:hypothetical protein ACHQM5_028003 [Ranunculus cassubicifolius]